MESGTEVLRVTAAIVSAFQTAADTLEIIQDRKGKKKRKKDKDVEELLEIKILHKSLVEGGMRCRKHCENRHQQFSPAFETGDDIAILALKDVLISLQGEVIQALHIARAVENAILDFTTLHETSVTNRKDATRAMDQLCQRIMASMQYGLHKSEARNPSDSSMRSSFASMPLSSYDLPPSPPASVGSPRQPDNQRAFSQRTLTIRPPIDKVDHRGNYNAPQASPLGWISSQVNHSSGDLIAGNTPGSTTGKEQSHQSPDDLELKRGSQVSIQHSALGSDRSSGHLQPASTALTTTSRYPQPSSNGSQGTSEHPPQHLQQGTASTNSATILASGAHRQNNGGSLGDAAEALSTWSRTTKPRPQRPPRIETADNLQPAFDAPEVVSADFEGIHAMPDESSEKYPSFLTQSDYAERLLSLPAGMDNTWMPLKRPAMHNRYHGFCKGAWQIRKAVHEGLEVQMTPALKEPVIHWVCKECKFRSRAPNANALPDQIQFNQKYGVRYRWLFLAKSHRGTELSCDMMENYKYGCIFCAAQGQTTAIHDKLEHLMVHIISKHKSTMMTPEVREKTKCVVGSEANQVEDWDINVPESTQRGAGVVADEFLISASKFFNRRKGRRS